MRAAWLVIALAACGAESEKAATAPAPGGAAPVAAEPPPPVEKPMPGGPVATNDPPKITPDPCEGGEVTKTGGDIGHVGPIGHGAGTGGGNPCGGGRGARPPVLVTEGKPTVSGGLDPAILHRYMRRNQAHFRACFEHVLAANPLAAGTVTATFTIGLDGKVETVEAKGMLEVDICVAGVIKKIEFPAPSQKMTVTYPFTFKSS